MIRSYEQGPGIDQPIASNESTTQQIYISDYLGSIVRLTNSSGSLLASNVYDSFGQQLSGPANRYSYTAREFDSDSGLYYYRARYYNPGIGRFTSEDPIARATATLREYYIYGVNNPIMSKDPLGLFRVLGSCNFCILRTPLCQHWMRHGS